jgi:hypothetical protein
MPMAHKPPRAFASGNLRAELIREISFTSCNQRLKTRSMDRKVPITLALPQLLVCGTEARARLRTTLPSAVALCCMITASTNGTASAATMVSATWGSSIQRITMTAASAAINR